MDGTSARRGGSRGGGRGFVPKVRGDGASAEVNRQQQKTTNANQPAPPKSKRGGYVPRPLNPDVLDKGVARVSHREGKNNGGTSAPVFPTVATPMVLEQAVTKREPASEPIASEAAIVEGRGGHRGKRMILEYVASRPATLATKCGSTGTKVSVQTNYFRVPRTPKWALYKYHVDFSPDIEFDRARYFFLSQHKEILGGYIFDGNELFCLQHLQKEKLELFSKNREGETILIKIKLVGIIENTDFEQLQVFNLILRRAMKGLKLQLVGRNLYDEMAKINLPQYNLQIWPGYATSIRQHEQDILLCCEIAHKVMRTETLLDTLKTCLKQDGNYQDHFRRIVIGSIVLTDYNNKTYRISDVDFNATPQSKFPTKDGEISYAEYYKKRYNLTIYDMKQPMLVSRPKEKDIRGGKIELIMLVPELSRATGMTDDMRNNFRLMKAMGDYTRLAPERRIDRLKIFNQRLQSSQESVEVLNSWNLGLDKNFVEVPGRIIPPQKIFFAKEHRYQCDSRADWTYECRNNKMYKQTNIDRWIVVAPSRNVREVRNFVEMCIKAARGMGMGLATPKYQEMPDDRNNSYSQAIDNAVSYDPQILMIILVRKNEEKYSCIKKKCCVDRPIPSQVCVLNTIAPQADKAKGLMSVATKVVIQMNAKLGGQPWLIDLPIDGLMTVGFDVCHSAKEKDKSYGALVATMDIKTSGRYYSHVTQHRKYQELSEQIPMSMTFALKAYQVEHKNLPQRIIFYRDGVGDGQLHHVYETEVKKLKKALDEFYESEGISTGCRFAFIVVSKRINTRYFVNRQNPAPGTVVDDIITLPERYDFFLVSQSVRQGTVSPTSYNVIYDKMGYNADKLQMLTYKMTHLYYNWSGTCRVPAVCQYAHKLAFLVATSIHRSPSNALERQLYFL